MNIIAATMVYNEGTNLERWIQHYGRHLGRQSLLIIDHGSTDGSTVDSGIERLVLPRSEFDDIQRADFVSDLCRSLLRYYDAFIYTDCDELLVADPTTYPGLRSYLETSHALNIRPIGFDVFHSRSQEPALDLARPVSVQRRYCWFRSTLCKPCIALRSVRWAPGFHHCSEVASIDPQLYLFHLKQVDFQAALRRLELTRNLQWSERSITGGMGAHQRMSDAEMIRVQFGTPESILAANGAKQFSVPAFQSEVLKLQNELELSHGIYRCKPYNGAVYEIPERLRGAF